jgi:hypothetical protein
MKKRFSIVCVSLCVEYMALKITKVKAHKRIRNGKVVKVRSYYRRVWGRP